MINLKSIIVALLQFDFWTWLLCVYVLGLVAFSIPLWRALLRKVELAPPGDHFEKNPKFLPDSKELLTQHYSRIRGTLGFWKNKAALYERLHYYCILWTIPSAVLIPILTSAIEPGDRSKITVTFVGTVTAILLALHKGLKVEENFKAFRHGESDFYDLYRRLLDRPESFGKNDEERLAAYFEEVERIRRFVRNAETDNLASLDDARNQLEAMRKKNQTE